MLFKITGQELEGGAHQSPIRMTGYEGQVAERLKRFVDAGEVTGFAIGAGQQSTLAVSLASADVTLQKRVEAALEGFPKPVHVLLPIAGRS